MTEDFHELGVQRVLFVVNTAWFFASHRLPIARALMAQGVDVHLAAPAGPDLDRMREMGIHTHAISLSRSGLNPLLEARSIAELFNLYRRLRPDIVHHVTPKVVVYGSLAARAAGVRAIVNAVSGLGHIFVDGGVRVLAVRSLAKTLYRLAFGAATAHIIFQNPSDRAILRAIVAGIDARSTLIPGSGVPLDEFTPTPEPAEPIVILAARLLKNKGVEDFVEAARQVRSTRPTVRMVLVGEPDAGNPTSVTAENLAQWQREGAIEWWGRRTDMAAVLAGAQIFCLPSRGGEGVPKVVLEAMASGRPVVTTDVPGCRDAVVDGETGFVVPPRDGRALAEALLKLLEDPALRHAFASKARARAMSEFGLEAVVATHLQIYRTLAATFPA